LVGGPIDNRSTVKRPQTAPDGDFSCLGEFERVAVQVSQHLAYPHRVLDHSGRKPGSRFEADLHPLRPRNMNGRREQSKKRSRLKMSLDRREIGDITTMTVEEYLAAPPLRRLYRHQLIMGHGPRRVGPWRAAWREPRIGQLQLLERPAKTGGLIRTSSTPLMKAFKIF